MASLLFDADPPGQEAATLRLRAAGIGVAPGPVAPTGDWALLLRDDRLGEARLSCPNARIQVDFLPPDPIVRGSPDLTREEVEDVRRARSMLSLMLADETLTTEGVLRDRKRLLRFARIVLGEDGLAAVDVDAERIWSRAALDDELVHDADLDLDSAYGLHAVSDEGRVTWLHTHGLAALDAFDFDILNPSPQVVNADVSLVSALAFAIFEKQVTATTSRHWLADAVGCVRMVPASVFDRRARDQDRGGRTLDAVERHTEARAVVCEPVGLLGRLFGRCEPSRFLSGEIPDGTTFSLSRRATDLHAARARATFGALWNLHEELSPVVGPAIVKLAYETSRRGREHLWFEVHRWLNGRIDATLTNEPFDVPQLRKGQRGEHELERVSDWILYSPRGRITPKSQAAARRVRADFDQLRAAVVARRASGK